MGGGGKGNAGGKGKGKGAPSRSGSSLSQRPPPVSERSGSNVGRASREGRNKAPESDLSAYDDDTNAVRDKDISMRAKICYNFLAFFAFWFGAARFDMDGDGDFDAADVQAMMNKGKKGVHLNFSRPPTNKKARELRRQRNEKKKQQREAEAAKNERSHQENMRINSKEGGIGGAVGNMFEQIGHGGQLASHGADEFMDAEVEEEAQEEEIMDNLRQALPYFSIIQVLLCLGLWGGNAFRTRSYRNQIQLSNTAIPEENIIVQYVLSKELEPLNRDICKNQCNNAPSCSAIGWKGGPFPECRLLNSADWLGTTEPGCLKDRWGTEVWVKQPWTWSQSLFMKGGLESMWPGKTVLSSYNHCKEGFDISFLWRWFSYQFTHGSITHVGANCFMIIMLGIPLEGYQGTGIMMLMWTIGVLGGAFCWMLLDPYVNSYGASGGCYSLLGMHLADHILNWGDKKWRYCTLFLMAVVTGIEFAAYWPNRDDASSTAHTVHLGGIVAGLLIGFTAGRNDHMKIHEYVCCGGGWVVATLLVVGSLYFWFFYNEHPAIANLWLPNERPLCWTGFACIDDNGGQCPTVPTIPATSASGQIASNSGTGSFNTQHQCVMCQTRECMEGFYSTVQVGDTEHYKYCPQEGSRRLCQFWKDGTGHRDGQGNTLKIQAPSGANQFDGEFPQISFDIEWPPTKSAYQLLESPAPTPAPTNA